MGRELFLTCHQLEHELSGMYDFVAHGAGLSVIFPAWARYTYKSNLKRFVQYAARVWGISADETNAAPVLNSDKNPDKNPDYEKIALAGIDATEEYFTQIGMPTRFSHLNIGSEGIAEMSDKCTFRGKRVLPGYMELGMKEISDIFHLAL